MESFRTAQGARFWTLADFSAGFVLNLDFYNDAETEIPFHLSVRRDEKLVVVNRKAPEGWRREIRFPMEFENRLTPVQIVFANGTAEVHVDERRIGLFDSLPRLDLSGRMLMRRGFPRLDQIAKVNVTGWSAYDRMVLDTSSDRWRNETGLHLNDSFEAVVRKLRAEHARDGVLRIAGMEETFRASLRLIVPAADRARAEFGMVALPPGRIWTGAGDTLVLTMTTRDGAMLGQMTLTRADLAARISELARAGGLDQNDRAALQALEHVKFAEIGDDLSPEVWGVLSKAAERFKLKDYLPERASAGAAPLRPAVAEDPEQPAIEAVERFTVAMRADPLRDPVALLDAEMKILAAQAANLPKSRLPEVEPSATADGTPVAPVDMLKLMFLYRLMIWFAQNDRMDDLLRYRRDAGLPYRPLDWPISSARSLMIALYYGEGRFQEAMEAMHQIAAPGGDWLNTPVIAWVMEQAARSAPALDGTLPLDWVAREILAGALNLIEWHSGDYWSHMTCQRLMRATVAILSRDKALPPEVRERAIWVAGKVYALNPGFWAMVDEAQAATGWVLPDSLRAMREVFEPIEAAILNGPVLSIADAERVDHALNLHRQLGTGAMVRFRRELFGPLGIAETAMGGALAPLMAGMDPAEGALRLLTFPRARVDLTEDQRQEALRGLERCNEQLVVLPFADQNNHLRAQAEAILAGDADAPALTRWLEALPPISGAQGRFVGIMLAFATARGLLDRGRADEAGQVLEQARRLVATQLSDRVATGLLLASSLVGMSFHALNRAHGDRPDIRALAGLLTHRLPAAPLEAIDDRAADLMQAASPLQNTLLCVYTCQPNLDTRVRIMRETWLPLLKAMGVPFLVFVGNGDGRREGDVVYLDAPDDYEGLPQKSLALAKWVLEHTNFAHLVKVDDDCFIDPEAWFGDLAHRGADYHGRRLHRSRGQVDRAWHQGKSRSQRGRFELDKSPEPSTYADGGTGYSLSRVAMAALVEAAQTAEGRELEQLSFMEDKLVGDLLSLRNIGLDNTGYHVSVLRRTAPGGPIVPQWVNGFLPFRGARVKLAHLDGVDRMAEVLAGMDQDRPLDRKIWPSYQPVTLGFNSNALDLVSSQARLDTVNEAEVAAVICLRNEMFILPAFLDHYRKLGVGGFLIADNGSDDGSFEYLAEQPDVALFSVDTEYGKSGYGVAWQQALMSNFRVGRWSLAVDADEFLFWNLDRSGDLPTLVQSPEFEGADAARIFMLDMYPEGSLSTADFKSGDPFAQAGFVEREPFLTASMALGPFSNSPTWTSALRHRLIPGSRSDLFVAQKYALLRYRPWMRLSAGLHYVSETRLARRELLFAHFKYNAHFRAKAQAEVARSQHFNNAEEYRKYLALVGEGRDVIHDPEISVPWDQAAFVRRVCGG
ncbi:hypothetical protein C4N9_14990 [Pararhodobacter marinus]|uniref:Galectin domain-containing protein n=1 Tax=Pararhodobacter marinus TaxID=2184063 RepID=A0A2U2C7B5_9RHOB|nr:hypothetical protein C4N9_14990 [Pararhodobacter marinus]